MATIIGTVIGKNSEPQVGAKVFVSNYKGKLTAAKIGALTDANGKFSLDITNKDDDYLTASNIDGITVTRIKPEIVDYTLDISQNEGRVQQHQEIVIKPKKIEPEPKKKNYWWLILLGIVVVGGTIYVVSKNKKKKK